MTIVPHTPVEVEQFCISLVEYNQVDQEEQDGMMVGCQTQFATKNQY
jgi:hypothetical protein